MAHRRGRGKAAADAYLIRKVEADPDTRTITVWTYGNPTGESHTFQHTALGSQWFATVQQFIAATGQGGTWGSSRVLLHATRWYDWAERTWDSKSFASPDLTVEDLRSYNDITFRSLKRAFAWAINQYHPNPKRLATQVLYTRVSSAIKNETEAYSDDEAERIERTAITRIKNGVADHKSMLALLDLDSRDVSWTRHTAEQILDIAAQEGDHESSFMKELAKRPECLFPTTETLEAFLVAMTLAENKGPNLSSLISLTEDSVNTVGGVSMTKARAGADIHTISADPEPETINTKSLAGLVRLLTALTRFTRHERLTQADGDPVLEQNARLLFVPAGGREVLGKIRGINSRRLRETALWRGYRDTREDPLVGHSYAQTLKYLAAGMPDNLMHEAAVASQNHVVRLAELALKGRVVVPQEEVITEVVDKAGKDLTVDRGVATCATGAVDPVTDTLCNRGILGCFFCPSGRLTDANLPSIKAIVTLTDEIRARDVQEWQAGPAQALNAVCSAALEKFPAHEVDAVPDQKVRDSLPLVAALYWEIRA